VIGKSNVSLGGGGRVRKLPQSVTYYLNDPKSVKKIEENNSDLKSQQTFSLVCCFRLRKFDPEDWHRETDDNILCLGWNSPHAPLHVDNRFDSRHKLQIHIHKTLQVNCSIFILLFLIVLPRASLLRHWKLKLYFSRNYHFGDENF